MAELTEEHARLLMYSWARAAHYNRTKPTLPNRVTTSRCGPLALDGASNTHSRISSCRPAPMPHPPPLGLRKPSSSSRLTAPPSWYMSSRSMSRQKLFRELPPAIERPLDLVQRHIDQGEVTCAQLSNTIQTWPSVMDAELKSRKKRAMVDSAYTLPGIQVPHRETIHLPSIVPHPSMEPHPPLAISITYTMTSKDRPILIPPVTTPTKGTAILISPVTMPTKATPLNIPDVSSKSAAHEGNQLSHTQQVAMAASRGGDQLSHTQQAAMAASRGGDQLSHTQQAATAASRGGDQLSHTQQAAMAASRGGDQLSHTQQAAMAASRGGDQLSHTQQAAMAASKGGDQLSHTQQAAMVERIKPSLAAGGHAVLAPAAVQAVNTHKLHPIRSTTYLQGQAIPTRTQT